MSKENSDIITEMERLLNPDAMIKQSSNNDVAIALDSLIKAADMFEEDGNYILAEAVTDLMERIPEAIKRGSK